MEGYRSLTDPDAPSDFGSLIPDPQAPVNSGPADWPAVDTVFSPNAVGVSAIGSGPADHHTLLQAPAGVLE